MIKKDKKGSAGEEDHGGTPAGHGHVHGEHCSGGHGTEEDAGGAISLIGLH